MNCFRGMFSLFGCKPPSTRTSVEDTRGTIVSRLAPTIGKFLPPHDLMTFELCSTEVRTGCSLAWPCQIEQSFPSLVLDLEATSAKEKYLKFLQTVVEFPGRQLLPSTQMKGKMKIETTFIDRDEVDLAFQITTKNTGRGLYLEAFVGSTSDVFLELHSNLDKRNIKFNPATGEVIQGKKVRQMLPAIPPEKTVRGSECNYFSFVGAYIQSGKVAFFRRCESREECTGFVEEFCQGDGELVAPRLTFVRPEEDDRLGLHEYHAIVTEVSTAPPMRVERCSKLRAGRFFSSQFWDKVVTRYMVRLLEWRGLL
eukprot:TRINITY_DN39961_c0_g1_i1.p1 TRINITY_DN39961_c0_g1~~TRINITY_DN39961_c0_g1_i1.p1  ORF type:complete len:311 (-),score=41.94 TRINITY_DN39961_c0_g1_i1:43-975(-)